MGKISAHKIDRDRDRARARDRDRDRDTVSHKGQMCHGCFINENQKRSTHVICTSHHIQSRTPMTAH